ncbi:hypothetical protein AN964_12850 [Heyndrickxia shackletonii]|uniref:DUF2848 domain-containing protein n=1 Tax=Heyndrickxia shackletonii TaxID=157838 RepID=A0A0Q3WSW9_9BACI|nr:DUF2848 family protein [Heyndrickxia shackletonii]KQL54293.1 hypothetical protein AN964_12850 [Heyndrickxia shackletonii]NEZ01229.1 DUF2848 domain-containing protein [Heyndrickxia shackletonii]
MKTTILPLMINNKEKEITINNVYCIGYAGRNMEKTMEHIVELEKIGVPRPPEIPTLYPIRRNSLNQTGEIQVLGGESSGEAEIVLVFGDVKDEVYITVGSDHTDRSLETIDINQSKQICDKPLANKAWNLNEVMDHWDDLILTSQVYIEGQWHEYQNAKIDEIIPLNEIKAFLNKKNISMKNCVIFSGTVPLLEGFKYGSRFRMAFIDKVRNEEIQAEYAITRLDLEV